MIIKSTVLAVIVFLGSLAVAEAQPFVNGGTAGPNTALGWNYGHLTNCYTVVLVSTTWFYAFAQEGGFGYTKQSRLRDYIIPSLPNWKCGWRLCH